MHVRILEQERIHLGGLNQKNHPPKRTPRRIFAYILKSSRTYLQGRPSPSETMMHFRPLFQIFPLFSRNFQTLRKMLTILPFPEKFLDFHPPKFLMTFFLVIDHKFRISPLFPENYSFPLLLQISPCFRQIHLLFTYFTCIFPPYFDHDAFMHHPMHVLDAPVSDRQTISMPVSN